MVSTNLKPAEKQIKQQGGLISYPAKLGLGDADLARVFSMMQTAPAECPSPAAQQESSLEMPKTEIIE